eukprot:TRINITY_DN4030_c0_g1_i2.p1 TRINITY_DN4030_c0_g1~~TRINITY_DN4030_c0_g1_i2.p1  ORF type:complete len:117 (+),score=23.90 TRINITY_DN4030_c0_g1_i2:53-403(+)
MAVHCICRATLFMPRCQASPASQTRRKEGKGKETRKGAQKYAEEEVYNIDSGWKVPISQTEEMIEIAGVQVPVRLKQQLKTERRLKETVEAIVAEPPPRLKHKLLRVCISCNMLSL